MLVGFFVVYLALLVWSVLWKLDAPFIGGGSTGEVKLVPFVRTDQFGTSKPFELVANVLLFVPFGLYLGLLLAPPRRWAKAVPAIAATSFALEAAQYLLAVGSADVSDLILNTAGGLVGLGLVAWARRAGSVSATTVLARVLAVGTGVALLASALFFVASPLRYGPPTQIEGSVPMSPLDAD
jgi:glycopeptide antibiotics resistance protein